MDGILSSFQKSLFSHLRSLNRCVSSFILLCAFIPYLITMDILLKILNKAFIITKTKIGSN